MNKIFVYALTCAFISVAGNASAQSTTQSVAAPTMKQAGGVAPKQTNTDNNTTRGNNVKQMAPATNAPASNSKKNVKNSQSTAPVPVTTAPAVKSK